MEVLDSQLPLVREQAVGRVAISSDDKGSARLGHEAPPQPGLAWPGTLYLSPSEEEHGSALLLPLFRRHTLVA